jgi:hypothetical protein
MVDVIQSALAQVAPPSVRIPVEIDEDAEMGRLLDAAGRQLSDDRTITDRLRAWASGITPTQQLGMAQFDVSPQSIPGNEDWSWVDESLRRQERDKAIQFERSYPTPLQEAQQITGNPWWGSELMNWAGERANERFPTELADPLGTGIGGFVVPSPKAEFMQPTRALTGPIKILSNLAKVGGVVGGTFYPPSELDVDQSSYIGDPAVADALQSALRNRAEVEREEQRKKDIEFMRESEGEFKFPWQSQKYTADPALEQALTHQYNPAEFGLDPFTREQVGTSSNFLANLMAEGTEAQKTAIQRAISPGTSGILRENLAAHFARDDAESPFMVDPSTGETYEFASRAPVDMANILRAAEVEPTISREQEIENMMIEDRAEQLKFHPASPLYEAPFEEGTGPEEEVSEERVVEIKKKPREERTSVEEQVVVASEVQKALSNASKGKKVKNELKAIVELAKVDPTIVKRYTTVGSQELQDITAQVDSFSFMPTIQKKKKPVPGYGLPPTRPGGR